jgi:hypothetical protein
MYNSVAVWQNIQRRRATSAPCTVRALHRERARLLADTPSTPAQLRALVARQCALSVR